MLLVCSMVYCVRSQPLIAFDEAREGDEGKDEGRGKRRMRAVGQGGQKKERKKEQMCTFDAADDADWRHGAPLLFTPCLPKA